MNSFSSLRTTAPGRDSGFFEKREKKKTHPADHSLPLAYPVENGSKRKTMKTSIDSMAKTVSGFLSEINMHTSNIDVDFHIDKFREEMQKGLEGKESSLAMLPHFIDMEISIPLNKSVAVLDAGGSHLKFGIVSFDSRGKVKIGRIDQCPIPGLDRRVTKRDFFSYLADRLLPLVDKNQSIGFCFSYSMESLPNLDGRLLRFTKEINAPEVEGAVIGEELLRSLREKGMSGIRQIRVLNDAVATLLACKTMEIECHRYSTAIGYILGTGCNASYLERNANIMKLGWSRNTPGSQIINTELGNYNQFPMGKADAALDKSSDNPGQQLMEKKVAGAYLGRLGYELLCLASEDLLSSNFRPVLPRFRSLTSAEISQSLSDPLVLHQVPDLHDEDAKKIMRLFEELVNRSALLVAIQINGLLGRIPETENQSSPAYVNLDGSTAQKLKGFKIKLKNHLDRMAKEGQGRQVELICLRHSPIIGAAIAGLME